MPLIQNGFADTRQWPGEWLPLFAVGYRYVKGGALNQPILAALLMGLMQGVALIGGKLGKILQGDAEEKIPFSAGQQRPDSGAEDLGDFG